MRKANIFVALVAMFVLIPKVEAKGSATVEFESDTKVNVGDIFTVNMIVGDVYNTYDGIVSLGGNLLFDSNVIKFISTEKIETPYQFQINTEANYKVAGLDFTLDNGIKTRTVVYSFKFEALKEGVTEISFTNAKLTDSKDYVDTTINGKTITISKVLETKEVLDKIEETQVVKEEQVTTEIVQEESNYKEEIIKQELINKINEMFKLVKVLFK